MRFAKKEKAHRHHKHKHRQQSDAESGTEYEAVSLSRSSTLDSGPGPSRQGSTETPKIGGLRMTTTAGEPGENSGSPVTPITPVSGSGSGTPGYNSTDPSLVDLTTPLITSSAAALANQEGAYEEDVQSECSLSSCSSTEASEGEKADDRESTVKPSGIVSVTGTEPLPSAGEHIVSERVSTRGRIRPFEPIHQVPALHPDLKEHIGQVHPEGAIKKWMAKRKEWDEKYKKDLDKWWAVKKADRERAEAAGYLTRDLGTTVGKDGNTTVKERPPLSALAGWYDREMAREVGKSVDEVTGKMGMGAMLWMRAGVKVRPQPHTGSVHPCLAATATALHRYQQSRRSMLMTRPRRTTQAAKRSKRSNRPFNKRSMKIMQRQPRHKSWALLPAKARLLIRRQTPPPGAADAVLWQGRRRRVSQGAPGRIRSDRRRCTCSWRRRGRRGRTFRAIIIWNHTCDLGKSRRLHGRRGSKPSYWV